MANRIQLRRDTSANWERVNPILEDGEPGLDITTNQIKYGDGSTPWLLLPYASGGSGSGNTLVNGAYTVSLGADGTTTFPGNLQIGPHPVINGTYITQANGIMQLASTGNGTVSLGWGENETSPGNVAFLNFNLNAPGDVTLITGPVVNPYIWTFSNTGALTLPNGGVLGSAGMGWQGFSSAPGYPLSVQAMDANNSSAIGLTLDYSQGVQINNINGQSWTFGQDNNTTIPGNVTIGQGYGNISMVHTISANNYVYANGVSILSGVGASTANTAFSGDYIYNAGGYDLTVTAVLDGGPGYAHLTLPTDSNASGNPTQLFGGPGGVKLTVGSVGSYKNWTFANDSSLTLPNSSGQIGLDGYTNGMDLYNGTNTTGYVRMNYNNQSYVWVDPAGAHVQTASGTWTFAADGTTTFPDHKEVTITGNLTVGNLFINGNATTINTQSYTVTDNVISIADGNPADTLDIGFTGHRTVNGVLQHTGLIRDASANNWKLFSNIATSPGNTADFANVIYDDLVVGNISSTTIDTITANLGSVAGSLATLTANAGAQAGSISTLTSNAAVQSGLIADLQANAAVQAGEIASLWANAGAQTATLTSLTSNAAVQSGLIADLQANAAVQAGLIANAQGNYSNANVASYLPTYSGNITAGNITTTGNVTAAYIVTSGGYGNISQVDTITANTGVYSGNITASGIAGFYAPNRPGFRVTGPGGQIASVTQVAGASLVVDFNQGSYLNTTTGYFTAPVAGLYQVNLVVRTYTNSGVSAQAVIEKNNSTVIIMVEWAANTSMNHTGGSTVTKLAAGDTLRFRVLLGSISFDANDNWSVAYIG